jgi:hypothetical protein
MKGKVAYTYSMLKRKNRLLVVPMTDDEFLAYKAWAATHGGARDFLRELLYEAMPAWQQLEEEFDSNLENPWVMCEDE